MFVGSGNNTDIGVVHRLDWSQEFSSTRGSKTYNFSSVSRLFTLRLYNTLVADARNFTSLTPSPRAGSHAQSKLN